MNFKELAQHLVTDTCPVGSGLELTWDANKFTGECFRRMARTYKERAQEVKPPDRSTQGEGLEAIVAHFEQVMEVRAAAADISSEIYADVLAVDRFGILQDWKLDDGTPPAFEHLMQVPGETLKFIFDFCREHSGPKGLGTPTSRTTSETSSDGSSAPTILSPESPTTLTTIS